jgi:hypothetical protein
MQSIDEMIMTLTTNPEVLGLIEYGGDQSSENYLAGDVDLFVILKRRDTPVVSLHFYAGGIPVDLNLITLEEISRLEAGQTFQVSALLGGRILYDPTGELAGELTRLRQRRQQAAPETLSAQTIAFIRHGHKHIFDKIRGRLETMPVFCRFLLNANIYWLIQSYFRVRHLTYRGEKRAIVYLQDNEPEIYQALTDFYSVSDLEHQIRLAKWITERVLAPVGGMWRDDEVLAFGDDDSDDLQADGYAMFSKLFGET